MYFGFSICTFLSLVAAFGGYSDKMLFGEISKRHLKMYGIFSLYSKAIENEQKKEEYNKVEDLIYTLGQEALDENADWLQLHRSKPIQLPKGG